MLPTQFTRMHLIALIVFSLLLTACGGGGGNSSGTGGAPAQTSFTIGGAVNGLNGTVVLQNNSGNDLTLTANGAFKFSTALSSGTAYAVTVKTAPASVIAQTCVVTNGNGIVSTVNVTNVVVTCTDVPPVAPAVTVTYGVKQVILNWTAVNGATYYQVSKRPNSTTAYAQLGSNLTSVSYADTVAVHLTDWINVSYIVAACNAGGCTNSAAINAFDAKQAIGYFKASNTGSNDNFGNSVALSTDGNTMAVGAINESSNATGIGGVQSDNSKPASGAVYIFTRNAGSWSQQAYLKASNTDADDYFGYAVALSADGNTLAVGAYQESSNATGINGIQSDNSKPSSGAVYVFTRSASSWTQQAYVKASNTDTSDDFGFAVALSSDGNILAVGAPLEASSAKGINGAQSDNSKLKSGAVYVFTRSLNNWTQQAYIKASNTNTNNFFGYAVALSSDGSTLAIGAAGEASNATGVDGNQLDTSKVGAGAAYVFVRSSNSWSQQAYIKASNADTSDYFGWSVALSTDGNTLGVSAVAEASNATGIGSTQTDNTKPAAGAAYVFVRSGNSWSQQAYIKASNTDANDQFGWTLALSADGNTLAVGAVSESSNATGINGLESDNTKGGSGAVFVFSRIGNSWSQRAYIKATNTDVVDQFGYGVALSGDGNTLAVGAVGESSNANGVNGDQSDRSQSQSGAVYVY